MSNEEKLSPESKIKSYLTGFNFINFCLILFGAYLIYEGNLDSKPLTITIGGTLFGSCIGIVFDRVANADISVKNNEIHDKIIKILELPNTKKITSEESDIKDFRKIWHEYHVTKLGGRFIWQYARLDFSLLSLPGYLRCEKVKVITPYKKENFYNIDAAVRGNKLIMIFTALSGDEIGLFIFNSFKDTHQPFVSGVDIIASYDTNPVICPVILSDKQLHGEKVDGDKDSFTINDSHLIEKLNQIWNSCMENQKFDFNLKGDVTANPTANA